MAIPAGTLLGPYEILAPLGAGGMGEVYRARDTRLGREAAVKLLLAEAASDPQRRQRFEQEARSASALNHPNIVTIYDIGSADATTYIAMELVEGRTLREVLADGPLPTRKLLDLAVQVADGLARAHEAGIVHRDLKPENVMVMRDGFAKILDFGLAKLTEMRGQDLSALATMTAAPPTEPGTVMGTAGYMSPEQASGQPLDFHSDQFSLGAILYEMATGQRAFHRKTGAETLVAIIREEPEPIGQLNPRAPAPVRWIVERCLAKDPEERYASSKDLARDLRSIRDHLSETSASESIAVAPARRRSPAWLLSAATLVAGAAIGIFALKAIEGRRPASASRFQRLTFRRGMIVNARFAPDGRSVVYGAAWDGNPVEIFTTRPDSPESRPLGIRPATTLSVSSTGELAILLGWRPVIGWENRGTLARMALDGGAPREILENVQEADWSPDGREMAVVHESGGERRLEYPIGKVLHRTSGWISHPRISPDGKLIAFVDHPHRGDSVGQVTIADLTGRKRATGPTQPVTGVAWPPEGKEVWFSGNAQVLALTVSGKTRDVVNLIGGGSIHDISRDGRVLLARGSRRRELAALAPGETTERNLTWLDWSFPSDITDDGRAVLFGEQNVGPRYLVYRRRTDGSPAILLGQGFCFSLSPDGKWALTADEARPDSELILLPTGVGQPRRVPNPGITYEFAAFFPDGRRLLVDGAEPGRGHRLYVQDVESGKLQPITPEGVRILPGRLVSPDGGTVAALGPERRILLYPTEPGEPRPAPGLLPDEVIVRWTDDGRALWVYRPNEVPVKVFRVDMTTGERTLWKELVPPDPAGVLTIGPIVMTPDGKSYAYSYRRTLDELFLAEGIR